MKSEWTTNNKIKLDDQDWRYLIYMVVKDLGYVVSYANGTLGIHSDVPPIITAGNFTISFDIKDKTKGTADISAYLTKVDNQIKNVVGRITDVGAASNRLESIGDTLEVQNTNMTSALSTIKDADIAEESAKYVQQQILQSASATLLTQANSAPQIALTLIQG